MLAEDGIALRQQLIAAACATQQTGINVNRSGNLSVRCQRGDDLGLLITPSALAYDQLTPTDLVFIRFDDQRAIGHRVASTEWRVHFQILKTRPEFSAVVHTHSAAATALSCHQLGLPAFHYMIAMAGGHDVRCAPYATFGTQTLSDYASEALIDRRACLLAHHGVLACGETLEQALTLATEIEHLAKIYLQARQLGEPPLLNHEQMREVLTRFTSYGRP